MKASLYVLLGIVIGGVFMQALWLLTQLTNMLLFGNYDDGISFFPYHSLVHGNSLQFAGFLVLVLFQGCIFYAFYIIGDEEKLASEQACIGLLASFPLILWACIAAKRSVLYAIPTAFLLVLFSPIILLFLTWLFQQTNEGVINSWIQSVKKFFFSSKVSTKSQNQKAAKKKKLRVVVIDFLLDGIGTISLLFYGTLILSIPAVITFLWLTEKFDLGQIVVSFAPASAVLCLMLVCGAREEFGSPLKRIVNWSSQFFNSEVAPSQLRPSDTGASNADAVEKEPDPNVGRKAGARWEEVKKSQFDEQENEDDILFGGKWLPFISSTLHYLILGATGSGKTILMRLIMQCVLPRIGKGKDTRAVVYDVKKEMYGYVRGMGIPSSRIRILDPFDDRCTPWDIARDIEFNTDATSIAKVFIPAPATDAKEPMWQNAAAQLLAGVMKAFSEFARDEKGNPTWTLRDVLLTLRTEKRLRIVLAQSESTRHLITDFLDSADVTFKGIKTNMRVAIEPLEEIAALWHSAKNAHNPVSFHHWANSEDEYILLIGHHHIYDEQLGPLNRAIFKRLIDLVLSGVAGSTPKPPRIWFFMDELANAGKIDKFARAMSQARSYGVCFILGVQEVSALKISYEGELGTVLNQPANKALLRFEDPESAKFASDIFGEIELEEVTQSMNGWSNQATTNTQKSLSTQSGTTTDSYLGFNKTWQSGGAEQKSSGTASASGSTGSVTKTKHRKTLIMQSEFLYMKETNPQNGLDGYYKTAGKGAWGRHLPGDELFEKRLLKPIDEDDNFIPRANRKEEEKLKEWLPEEVTARLRLLPLAEIVRQEQERFEQMKAGRTASEQSYRKQERKSETATSGNDKLKDWRAFQEQTTKEELEAEIQRERGDSMYDLP